ncbi:hypothetical protein ELY33_00895 [Vreelandella andesensis]|uniref:Uncharacterized protein n=1 Tax=Vreelandella andesensis TaxID=447567 RepID=A0A433KZ55_9GAMM|nr:hypothetical protein [Halomonas andesensis]RUR34770.1 hypothetical protein ELY33_00895 [Halomonas andesensis]
MKLSVILGLLFLVVSSASFSHSSWQASHSCFKPVKPYEFQSQWEANMFNNEVDVYRNCIEQFVSEQENAIQTHSGALDEAIDEWNDFVNFELNISLLN